MNNIITTYDHLKQEEQRLTALLIVQKEIIKNDVRDIKEELNPVFSAGSNILKLTTYDNHDNKALKAGANIGIDWLVQKLLPRSGFLIKMLLPTVLKNYSSHYVGKAAPTLQKIGTKLRDLVTRKRDTAVHR